MTESVSRLFVVMVRSRVWYRVEWMVCDSEYKYRHQWLLLVICQFFESEWWETSDCEGICLCPCFEKVGKHKKNFSTHETPSLIGPLTQPIKPLILLIACSRFTVCHYLPRFVIFTKRFPNIFFSENDKPRQHPFMRHPKLNAVRYYRISTETIFGLNVYVHNMRCFFYNTLATIFLGPDVSLGFNISDPNVALTHSTFQNGNLN